jgi:hypothetical protein
LEYAKLGSPGLGLAMTEDDYIKSKQRSVNISTDACAIIIALLFLLFIASVLYTGLP